MKKIKDLYRRLKKKKNIENTENVDSKYCNSFTTKEDMRSFFINNSEISKKPFIIIADDISINRLILKKMITPLHIDIDFAEDGQELVDKCMMKKYSLILCDTRMPIMSGDEACRIIKKNDGPNKNTNIICISGSNESIEMSEDHILKPISKCILFKKLSYWLRDEEIKWIDNKYSD